MLRALPSTVLSHPVIDLTVVSVTGGAFLEAKSTSCSRCRDAQSHLPHSFDRTSTTSDAISTTLLDSDMAGVRPISTSPRLTHRDLVLLALACKSTAIPILEDPEFKITATAEEAEHSTSGHWVAVGRAFATGAVIARSFGALNARAHSICRAASRSVSVKE